MIHDWMKALLAILLGNVVYFVTLPILPPLLVHHLYKLDAGVIFDLAICAGIYLLLRRRKSDS
jgi:hypothetical protein